MRFIGSKKLLLGDIERVICENINNAESFCDIFSGTVSVGKYFKNKYKIITNDLLYFSYCLQKAIIESNTTPKFDKLGFNPIEYFNNVKTDELSQISKEKCFCLNNYSPIGGRMYLTEENSLKIDYIRNTVNDWREKKIINDKEK